MVVLDRDRIAAMTTLRCDTHTMRLNFASEKSDEDVAEHLSSRQ